MSMTEPKVDKDIQRTIFFRQRKSLLLTSMLLFFVYYAHLTISSITSPNLNVELAVPEALHFILWVSWGYFFLRYIQYYLITARGGLSAVYQMERDGAEAEGAGSTGLQILWRVLFFNTYLTDYLLPLAFAVFAAAFALVVR